MLTNEEVIGIVLGNLDSHNGSKELDECAKVLRRDVVGWARRLSRAARLRDGATFVPVDTVKQLANYCANRAIAIDMRRAGLISTAFVYDRTCDALYPRLRHLQTW